MMPDTISVERNGTSMLTVVVTTGIFSDLSVYIFFNKNCLFFKRNLLCWSRMDSSGILETVFYNAVVAMKLLYNTQLVVDN
jgi:hypothetical protein